MGGDGRSRWTRCRTHEPTCDPRGDHARRFARARELRFAHATIRVGHGSTADRGPSRVDPLGLVFASAARAIELKGGTVEMSGGPQRVSSFPPDRRTGARVDGAGGESTSRHLLLTARERQVLVLIARGETSGYIARAIGVSEHTVKKHVTLILARLDCRSRAAAVARALAWGVLGAEDVVGPNGTRPIVDGRDLELGASS